MRVPRLITAVLQPFVLTRGFVLLVTLLVPALTSRQIDNHRALSVNKDVHLISEFQNTQAATDAPSYKSIAERGYDKEPFDNASVHNWGFFPLYPLLISVFHTEFYITGAIVSNLLFLAALFLMFYVSRESGLDEGQSTRAMIYLALYPTSYFFSMALTESLFMALTLLSVYLALRDRWWFAGAVAALASATRVPGVLLFGLLLLLYFQKRRQQISSDILGVFLAPVGLVVFMIYIWAITGNPLGAIQAQNTRDVSGGFFLTPLISFVSHPYAFAGWGFGPLSFAIVMLVFFSVYMLARSRQWAFAFYTILSAILPLSTGTLTSIPRYIMVVFPIYIVLAKLGHEKIIGFAFTTLLALLTVLCALHYTFAVC